MIRDERSLDNAVQRALIAAVLLLGFGAFLALATDFGNNFDNKADRDDNVLAVDDNDDDAPHHHDEFDDDHDPGRDHDARSRRPRSRRPRLRRRSRPPRDDAANDHDDDRRPPPRPSRRPHPGQGTENVRQHRPRSRTTPMAPTRRRPRPSCPAADPFCFVLGSRGVAASVETGNIPAVKLESRSCRNNTAKTITFPGGLTWSITVHNDGVDQQFSMTAADVTIHRAPVTAITISTQERASSAPATYTFNATCRSITGRDRHDRLAEHQGVLCAARRHRAHAVPLHRRGPARRVPNGPCHPRAGGGPQRSSSTACASRRVARASVSRHRRCPKAPTAAGRRRLTRTNPKRVLAGERLPVLQDRCR